MPNARTANAVRLEFAPGALVRSRSSGAAVTGDWLWVAGSHGLTRKNTKPERGHPDGAKRLAKVAIGVCRPPGPTMVLNGRIRVFEWPAAPRSRSSAPVCPSRPDELAHAAPDAAAGPLPVVTVRSVQR